MLGRAELLASYDLDVRAGWIMPEAQREVVVADDGGVALVRWRRPEMRSRTVLSSDLGRLYRAQVEAVVDRNLADDRADELDGYWKLHDHDAPSDLGALLAARGYVPDDDPGDEGLVMLRDLATAVPAGRALPDAEVRRVGVEALDDVVVPEHRRRGLYAAVLNVRLREAADRGYGYAAVEPSPVNVPIVGSVGFETLTRATELVLRRP